VDEYFQGFAKRFEAQPATRSKILFAQAGLAAGKDQDRAFELMKSAYDPAARLRAGGSGSLRLRVDREEAIRRGAESLREARRR
jgi:hypothetical protein